ncbi:hypothetical protein CQY20_07250 [Mycolicibacterium agri]|uniref:Secreted protein n=1 Tax=Mycolicibacterium agri TaxID=36811 RepID=A0A2A7N9J6_MYCAG|nr:hypothetical protein [Mycolicibacterium agri]PEG40715.1 hypothetical protein CQY20_07250 [Mycolicibacterium agri]GFG49399.1 hypothetical protein MAGR_08400 [Mycolicibacterium agri]
MTDTRVRAGGGRMHMPRSRGALSGFLLILLGAWGALIPFVGPLFDFAFTPDREWAWTTGRGWLEVLPGAAAVVGGFLLLVSRNRFTAMLGGWLAVLAGAWFVVGRALAGPLGLGDAGTPVASTETKAVALDLAYFYGLGALIIFLGAMALGRLSVRSARDVRYAERTRAPMTTVEPAPSDEVTEVHPVGGHTNAAVGSRTDAAMNAPVDVPADGRHEGVEPVRERRRFGGLFGRRDRLAHH